jgi:glutaredoxin
MSAPRITLLGRPGCHLCDDAREVIRRVADDLGVAWEERDITQSEDDLREYWEQIPVTFVDGVYRKSASEPRCPLDNTNTRH